MAVKSAKEWLAETILQKPTIYLDGEKLEKPYEDPRIFPYVRGQAGARQELSTLVHKFGYVFMQPWVRRSAAPV